MNVFASTPPQKRSKDIPLHLDRWELPPGWRWGDEGVATPYRHAMQVIDAFDRPLALVTAPDPAHESWLFAEARQLAHRNHPNIPTAYHFWRRYRESRRGPGYLRRWVAGETVGARLRRIGTETVPYMLRVLRGVGSALAYLHDSGTPHGAVSPDNIYTTPAGRLYLLGWQWAVTPEETPAGLRPDARWVPLPQELASGPWRPTPASDQWQLGAVCFAILTGELPPRDGVPPIRFVRPDVPASVAELIDRSLAPEPGDRFFNLAALLRQIERISGTGTPLLVGVDQSSGEYRAVSEEDRLRWATGDDYEVLASLGTGQFGSVWRVRDLSLEREVALKMLHPNIARNEDAVARFRREARLAAQLKHPAIVPIYAWDSKGDVSWYIMEVQEEGSVADLVARQGPRGLQEIAPQVDAILDGLGQAHANGIIHRDIKPENILIDRYRRWRLSDFGIANALGDDKMGASGTPAFAAPEQLLGEAQGVAADLFAVAGIVVFALTGKLPFGGGDARAILAQQLAGKVDLSAFPRELADWLATALSPEPERRFRDASEMRREWRALTRELARQERRATRWSRWWKATRRFFLRPR
ncbi:MAG TPA: serine/threonine-protein kinase [Gemmatimonadaceae bacterium]|jgi:serine/threonine-protein kinase